MAALLVASIAANIAGVALVVVIVHRRGGTGYLRQRFRPSPCDYAAAARDRFAPIESGAVVFAGDSHAQNAPLLEILAGVAQRGIGGQCLADVTSWVTTFEGASRVVLMAGTNDVLTGAIAVEVADRFSVLLDAVPDGAEPVVLGLPPLAGHDVAEVNAAVESVVLARGVRFVALPDLAGCSDDGVHLTREGYDRLAPLLRDVLAGSGRRVQRR